MRPIAIYQLLLLFLAILACASKPAMKFRGANASSFKFCTQAQRLIDKYNQCRDEDCRTLYKNQIREAVKESERAQENCEVNVPGEHICAKAARHLDGYKASLYASPQDLWFFANKVNTLREKIQRDNTHCDVEIPRINLCAQAEADLSSIEKECANNTLCRAYYYKRIEKILSQLKKHKDVCYVTLPREEIQEEMEDEQAEGIEINEPTTSSRESFCKRAEDELAVYKTNNCEDLDCQLYHIELIKESLHHAEDRGEICPIEVPKIDFCIVAFSGLNSYHHCGENVLCQGRYISLMQSSLRQAEYHGQHCKVKVPVLKGLPVMNSSSGYEYTGPSCQYDTIEVGFDENEFKNTKTGVVADYGYSFSIEL